MIIIALWNGATKISSDKKFSGGIYIYFGYYLYTYLVSLYLLFSFSKLFILLNGNLGHDEVNCRHLYILVDICL